MKEFAMVGEENFREFKLRVDEALQRGWELHGPVIATPYPSVTHNIIFVQAFVREKETEDDVNQ